MVPQMSFYCGLRMGFLMKKPATTSDSQGSNQSHFTVSINFHILWGSKKSYDAYRQLKKNQYLIFLFLLLAINHKQCSQKKVKSLIKQPQQH